MVLEALRRGAKEYDAFLIRRHKNRALPVQEVVSQNISLSNNKHSETVEQSALPAPAASFRPTVLEQAIRALLHMLQFATAYFIMLLAMYYNGYIIISIFIGAYLGAFLFNWTCLDLR